MSRIKIFVSRDWAPIRLGTLTRALPLLLVLGVLVMAGALSQAQSNFTVIHTFTGLDGAFPYAGPTLDSQGNLYGTTWAGGARGDGLVYQLAHVNGSWILHPLYSFTYQGFDGAAPFAGVTIGPDGTLFGTTVAGGMGGYGTLFNVKPPAHAVCATALCPWTGTTLHSFAGYPDDGANPYGNVVFDPQGNLYGTTLAGGVVTYDGGTVYKATRSGGTWNVSVIYSFSGDSGYGHQPLAGLVLDGAGNLYGTTPQDGPNNGGMVFELSPLGGGWIETELHFFWGSDGSDPEAGLVIDRAGNLYGATVSGTIFKLSPQGSDWNFTTIYTLSGTGPHSSLAIDAAGNLYGIGGRSDGYGNVWELSPSSGGRWTYTDLYEFTGGNDGEAPWGGLAVTGPGGYLYGTTLYGGANGLGVIYQINLGAR
jgi:uncharacterized repeat protein (TIGR03803 family)